MILYPVIISCTDVCLTCRSKCNANCCTTCIILSLHILPVQHIPIHHIVLCCNMLPVSEITHTHSISKQHLSTLFITSCNNKILLIMVFPPHYSTTLEHGMVYLLQRVFNSEVTYYITVLHWNTEWCPYYRGFFNSEVTYHITVLHWNTEWRPY